MRLLPVDEETTGLTTLLATPGLLFRFTPYAVEALANAVGRMLKRTAPLFSCTFDWRDWTTDGFVEIGLLMLPVPEPRVDVLIASFFKAFSALFAAAFLAICAAS